MTHVPGDPGWLQRTSALRTALARGMTLIDLFPQKFYIETVVHLRARGTRDDACPRRPGWFQRTPGSSSNRRPLQSGHACSQDDADRSIPQTFHIETVVYLRVKGDTDDAFPGDPGWLQRTPGTCASVSPFGLL